MLSKSFTQSAFVKNVSMRSMSRKSFQLDRGHAGGGGGGLVKTSCAHFLPKADDIYGLSRKAGR
jgi:hypothetical protein